MQIPQCVRVLVSIRLTARKAAAAVRIVLLRFYTFESNDKSSHSENDSERRSVYCLLYIIYVVFQI